MFITSRNFSQLRELISLADAERNNPEVILIGCRKHPEMIRRQSEYHCTTWGKRGADVGRDFNFSKRPVEITGYR
jgi:4-hydroxy-3-methylbut-2-enyl diphosphate reductase IspH